MGVLRDYFITNIFDTHKTLNTPTKRFNYYKNKRRVSYRYCLCKKNRLHK